MSSTDKPPPAATPTAAEPPRASRLTTVVLLVSLVLVVLVAGVLGTLAVLMTRNPESPPLGGRPPTQLTRSIHFAPVRESKPACPGEEAFLDARGRCYLLEPGITVTAVRKIEPVELADSSYAVRIAFAPAFLPGVKELVDDLYRERRQLAVVHDLVVVAAPAVTQEMTGDSLMISGFTKAEADSLALLLRGSDPATPSAPGPVPSPTVTDPLRVPGVTPSPTVTGPLRAPGAAPAATGLGG